MNGVLTAIERYRPGLAAFVATTLVLFAPIRFASADDSSLAAREKVERMSDAEKAELSRKYKQFNGLDAADQEKLRKLHDEIDKDPDSQELLAVMERYSKWLESLPLYNRSELASMPPKDRVEWIKKRLQEESERSVPRGLNAQDVEILKAWMREFTEKNQAALSEKLTKQQRERLNSINEESRGPALAMMLMSRGFGRSFEVSEADVADIESRLTEETREKLKNKKPNEKANQVREWIGHLMFQRFANRREWFFAVDDERLTKFFQELPDDQRNRLLNLSSEEMQRMLQVMFLTGRPMDAVLAEQRGFFMGNRGGMGPNPGMGPGGGRRGDGPRRGSPGEGQDKGPTTPPDDRNRPPMPDENPADRPPREGERRDGETRSDEKRDASKSAVPAKQNDEKKNEQKPAGSEKPGDAKPAASSVKQDDAK